MLRLFNETRRKVRTSPLTSIYENYKELEELWDWCLDEAKTEKIEKQRHRYMVYNLRCKRLSIFWIETRYSSCDSDNLSKLLQAKDL